MGPARRAGRADAEEELHRSLSFAAAPPPPQQRGNPVIVFVFYRRKFISGVIFCPFARDFLAREPDELVIF